MLQFEKLRIPGIQNAQKLMEAGHIQPTEMNMWELGSYIDSLKQANALSNDKYQLRYYQKFSQPLACLIVALAEPTPDFLEGDQEAISV
ncbi:MAG: LptF/LptG family permease [Cyanobacteriota/Melainabacteria group bacterium]